MTHRGMRYTPPVAYAKVDPERATRIAQAYEAMEHNPHHPLTHAAYDAMVRETMDQYLFAKRAGLKAEFWHPDTERDPYGASPRLAIEDINRNHHMYVFPTSAGFGKGGPTAEDIAENPLLQNSGERWNGEPVTVNDIFRATHDYFGHAKEGVGFRADGEENAWRSHAAMYSPLARIAMTNETRGQNSWVNFGPHAERNQNARTEDTVFAPQKIGFLPSWVMHEGAEDFTSPDEIARIKAAYGEVPREGRKEGGAVSPDDLFDMSLMERAPQVPQFGLARYDPPRGTTARMRDLIANQDVRQKVMEAVERGRNVGSVWYNAEPLRHEFVKAHGNETGNQLFRKYMDFVAATSPKSEVGANVRNASYYFTRHVSGPGVPRIGERNPHPYGHISQRLHQMNAERVAGPGWDPLQNPKPASFAENLAGNWQPGTMDTHAFRLPAILAADPRFVTSGLQLAKGVKPRNVQAEVERGETPMSEAVKRASYWDTKPKANEYAAMEKYYSDIGREMGLAPAQTQAAAWVGGGETTGLGSDPTKPFMGFVADRIAKTAQATGRDPQDVLHGFVRGETPLRASGGRVYPIAPRSDWFGDANYQSTGGKLVHMSPDEFLSQARPLEIDDISRENIDDLKHHITSGGTLDPLALYPTGSEDGRHRANAAKELGIDKVPVLTWPRPERAGGGNLFHVHRGYHAPHVRLHVGPIHSPVAGRTDHLPMHVPHGSYVVPADVVSAHGEGNTIAGFKVLRRVFGGMPYSGAGMPYGATGGPYGEPLHSKGGQVKDGAGAVPIVAAGGEYVVDPSTVRRIGEGDLDLGHRVLDAFVERSRAEAVTTMKKLPGPAKN
jgi:hypothetical protein